MLQTCIQQVIGYRRKVGNLRSLCGFAYDSENGFVNDFAASDHVMENEVAGFVTDGEDAAGCLASALATTLCLILLQDLGLSWHYSRSACDSSFH